MLLERYHYSPYGKLYVLDGNFANDADGISDYLNPYTYTGRRFELDTGLYQYRHRYYHAQLGRFVGRDPKAYQAADANLYRYSGSRPINATDPSGTTYVDLWMKYRGKQIPKNVAVDVSKSDVAVTGAAYGTQAVFFPDSCELGFCTIGPAILLANGTAANGFTNEQNAEHWSAQNVLYGLFGTLPIGLDVSISANVSVAFWQGNPAPGSAHAGTWDGIFYGGTADTGILAQVGAGVFWDPNFKWVGGSVGVGGSVFPVTCKHNP